ncbi:glycosyl hydrolase family 18 protein [Thermococcus sp.]|uniref:glycosyl hydrolase family 18 protein n=1 Tax=Thermococcus sp. TaxID=35749 RepID=UPI0026088ED3|nr:glycosyl hydrolase family 18 protein [Thermococcus sp.]
MLIKEWTFANAFILAVLIISLYPGFGGNMVEAKGTGGITYVTVPAELSRVLYGFWPYWTSSSYAPDWREVTHVAFFDIPVSSDGSIDTSHIGDYYYSVRNEAHSHGARVLLTFTCFDHDTQDRVLAYHKVALVRNIVSAVEEYGADGAVIDFEFIRSTNSLTGKSNSYYVEWFFNYLHDELKKVNPMYEVAVAVTGSVEDVFRNSRLARYLDYVFLMGYDYHWAGAPNTGAVAPFDDPNQFDVLDSIGILLKYYPREKIVLGAPLYGYDWPASSASPGASTLGLGSAVLVKYAVPNAQKYGRHWDGSSHSPYYYYKGSDGHWHQCWYDDDQSIGIKFDYANRAGLAGGGFWALGYEGTSDVWTSIWETVNLSLAVPRGLRVTEGDDGMGYSIGSHSGFSPAGTGEVDVRVSNPGDESEGTALAALLLPVGAGGKVKAYGWGFSDAAVPAGSTTTVPVRVRVLGSIGAGTYNLTVYRLWDGLNRSEVKATPVAWTLVDVSPRFSYSISVPQVVTEGSRFEVNVTVSNTGDPVIHNVTVTLSLPGELSTDNPPEESLAYLDPATDHLLYGLGVNHTFSWNVTATTPGLGVIEVTVHTNDGGSVTISRQISVQPKNPPRVVINEIMYWPSQGDDGYGEWVELYNPNDFEVDVSGWWLGSGSGGYTFPTGTVIPAKGFLVVAKDSDWLIGRYSTEPRFDGSAVYGNASFILDDGGGSVSLKSAGGAVVDSVTYSPSWGGSGDGKSIERKDPAGDSNDPSNWAESAVDGGTPTYQNSVAVPFFGGLWIVGLAILAALTLYRRR